MSTKDDVKTAITFQMSKERSDQLKSVKSGSNGKKPNPKLIDLVKVTAKNANGCSVSEAMEILNSNDTVARGQLRNTAEAIGQPLYIPVSGNQVYCSLPYDVNNLEKFEQELIAFKNFIQKEHNSHLKLPQNYLTKTPVPQEVKEIVIKHI